MKQIMKNATSTFIQRITVASLLLIALSISAAASPVIRQGSGADPAALQSILALFRADLGGSLNPNTSQSFVNGRREINWDNVPENMAEPNHLPPNFFNVNIPAGVVFNSIEDATGAALNRFAVSATAESGTAVNFGNINQTYGAIFQTFSSQRLFIARNTHLLEITFFIPGTKIPATVNGFGLIFADVDSSSGGARSLIRVYGADGTQLSAASAAISNIGLSFVGISFNAGERIARVVIECGNAGLSQSNNDGVNGIDVVAMDDFIYGEPRAARSPSADFDGDGRTDTAIFRPSTGTWFIKLTSTGAIDEVQFGQLGDIPVDGNFDGDGKSDVAVYRPSTGSWLILRSVDGQLQTIQFGGATDVPVPGDYDGDGKTDAGVWIPAQGVYKVKRSSDGGASSFRLDAASPNDTPIQISSTL